MRRKSFTRDQRKHMVKLQLAIWIQNDNQAHWATSYEIARALDMTASPHLREILNEMVDEGELVSEPRFKSGRWPCLEYMLAPGTYTPPRARQIRINPSRKNSGQLEFEW